jgi:FkbM family methyltransferase
MDKLFRHLNPKTTLDIGAHVGGFTRSLLTQFPNCQVIMVEANPKCESHLQNIGVKYEMVALSDYNGVANLYIENNDDIGTGASLYKENTNWYSEGKKQTVTTKRLDDCNYFDGAPIDLIKMDVQGSELDVVKGGLNTIKNATFVMMETSLLQYNQGAPLIDSVVERMISLDFCMWDIVEYHKLSDGTIFQLDILFKNLKQ